MRRESRRELEERMNTFIWDSLPEHGGLQVDGKAEEKVLPNGAMRPFAGNTVVYGLPPEARIRVEKIREQLHAGCGSALAERLQTETFHMTLHDLLSGQPSGELERQMAELRQPVLERVRAAAAMRRPIRMHAVALFNMVRCSMVLGLAPDTDGDWEQLLDSYELFEDLRALPYPLTPHVTVCYFRPMIVQDVQPLRHAVETVNHALAWEPLRISLQPAALKGCTFTDMNHCLDMETGMPL